MKLYHGTLRKNLIKILKEGINPHCGRKNNIAYRGRTGTKNKCVALTHDFFEAVLWANRKVINSHDKKEIPIVIEVEIKPVRIYPMLEKFIDDDGETQFIREYAIMEPIPPEKIIGFTEVQRYPVTHVASLLGKKIDTKIVCIPRYPSV